MVCRRPPLRYSAALRGLPVSSGRDPCRQSGFLKLSPGLTISLRSLPQPPTCSSASLSMLAAWPPSSRPSPFPRRGVYVLVSSLSLNPIAFPDLLSSRRATMQDVGKSSSDLLSRDYPLSGTQLEVKAKAPSGVAFTARGTKDSASNAVNGDFEGRWNDRKKGLSVTQVRRLSSWRGSCRRRRLPRRLTLSTVITPPCRSGTRRTSCATRLSSTARSPGGLSSTSRLS
jgi:hypothetical protein